MRPNEHELLRLIARETARLEAEPFANFLRLRDLKAGLGVRVSGAWLGHHAAARQARKRALAALERQGLIELCSRWSERHTHVFLTELGRQTAMELEQDR